MFRCLIGRKFSRKCKHSVKCIKRRMETIRKKKQAMVRYLKKDVAVLISRGHETIVFGRMDALIVEINQTSCYDMIDQYCCCILEHLPTMQKERVCPEEATEAIATLIFAAARFSDLPELTDLRSEFTNRYGTHMEAYINKEFAEKMQNKSFPQDMKLWLMQDIVLEFSIHWDLKAFEYKISNPSASTFDQPKIQFPSCHEDSKPPILNKEENFGTSYHTSDLQKKQVKSEERINSKNIEEYQKIIQMRRSEHHPHDITEKTKKVASNEFENVESNQFHEKVFVNVNTKGQNSCRISESFHERMDSIHIERQNADSMESRDATVVNIIPPYTKVARDFKRPSNNQDDFTHSEVVNEMDHIVSGSQPNRTINSESTRAFNLKPPYVKRQVTKSTSLEGYAKPTNYEMSYGGNYLMSPPFSIRRTATHADSTVEDVDLLGQIPFKQVGTASTNIVGGVGDDQQNFIFQLSKQIEDDATNDAIYRHRHRHMQRIFSSQPSHGGSRLI